MKKGSLYILGHVIVTEDFGGSVPEARRQQAAWTKYIDFSKIKAFVNIAISPGVEWGARNIVLSAGLGGMRPNIAVLGFYNFDDLTRITPLIDFTDDNEPTEATGGQSNKRSRRHSKDNKINEALPTDTCKTEETMKVTSYVTILEDLLLRLQINVAVAKGFQGLEFPKSKGVNTKKYIDLWPIQMSAEIAAHGNTKQNVLTTNFDTYTLILQLGVILNTVPAWKKAYQLRVAVFVEYESDVEEERGRVQALLENLRIEAEVLVFWLASGDLQSYEIIVNGSTPGKEYEDEVEECLGGQDWWDEIQKIRGNKETTSATEDLTGILTTPNNWPEASFQQGPRGERVERFLGLRRLLRKSKRKHTMSGISKLGVSLGMTTHRLSPNITNLHASQGSASEVSSSESDSETDSDEEALESAASEGDMDDFESEDSPGELQSGTIRRRRSHGDSMRGPPPSKKSTGERQIKVPERIARMPWPTESEATTSAPELANAERPKTSISKGATSEIPTSVASSRPESIKQSDRTPLKPDQTNRPGSARSERPPLSRHASMPKFTSKPVPITRVATEDGPGPSIMFTDTPSPPIRNSRLPSAYRASASFPDHIPEVSEGSPQSRNGSQYFTQSLPISFNDLPCRAQHLILNELMRQQSEDTAVMFTTLPSPVEGTCKSEAASRGYLSDLEVLCKDCPPILMVHSNSMTVTMSL